MRTYGVLAGDQILPALAAGLLAGLAVALPLGAVGVLLLQEGMTRGRRSALLGATAVAMIDLVYAGAAVLAGAAVTTALADRQSVVRLISALVLGGLALWGLRRTMRARSTPSDPSPAFSHSYPAPSGRSCSAFWRFCALTALNPLTAVYFTVLAAGLGQRLQDPLPAAAFVLGVFVGFLAWQTVLALTGAALGMRLSADARVWTSTAGYLVVLALAITLALSA